MDDPEVGLPLMMLLPPPPETLRDSIILLSNPPIKPDKDVVWDPDPDPDPGEAVIPPADDFVPFNETAGPPVPINF